MATQDDKNRELRASVEAFRHAAKELQRSIDNANALLGLVGDAIDALAQLVETEPDKRFAYRERVWLTMPDGDPQIWRFKSDVGDGWCMLSNDDPNVWDLTVRLEHVERMTDEERANLLKPGVGKPERVESPWVRVAQQMADLSGRKSSDPAMVKACDCDADLNAFGSCVRCGKEGQP